MKKRSKYLKFYLLVMLILYYFCIFSIQLSAFPFSDPVSFGINVFNSGIVMGDINNDGYLDLIVTGDDDTTVRLDTFINNGAGEFTGPVPFGQGVRLSSLALGDLDNDGDLDLIVTGYAGVNGRLDHYTNNGYGVFTGPTSFGTGVYNSSIALGDLDNDGDLDMIVSGYNGIIGRRLEQYTNNGYGKFSSANPINSAVENSSIALGDMDNDGDLDMIVSGYAGTGNRLDYYTNNGYGVFTGPTPIGTGAQYSSIALGDLNNDGYQDLIVTGGGSGIRFHQYMNNTSGGFTGPTIFSIPVQYSSIALGDLDNDGAMDLIVTGRDISATFRLDQYTNSGTGVLTGPTSFGAGVYQSSIALGDVNNDNALDLIVTGNNGAPNPKLDHYTNLETIGNQLPSIPTGLKSSANAGFWSFSWNASSDDHTSAKMIRYNIAISTNNKTDFNYISDCIAYPRGQANIGNVNQSEQQVYHSIIPASKTVYWKVCAIDSAFALSGYSTVYCTDEEDDEEPAIKDLQDADKVAVFPTVIDFNDDSSIKIISADKKSNADIQIMTVHGIIIFEKKNVNMSKGYYDYTVKDKSLFPAGVYFIRINNDLGMFKVIR